VYTANHEGKKIGSERCNVVGVEEAMNWANQWRLLVNNCGVGSHSCWGKGGLGKGSGTWGRGCLSTKKGRGCRRPKIRSDHNWED